MFFGGGEVVWNLSRLALWKRKDKLGLSNPLPSALLRAKRNASPYEGDKPASGSSIEVPSPFFWERVG
jgi:hypothetical protein